MGKYKTQSGRVFQSWFDVWQIDFATDWFQHKTLG